MLLKMQENCGMSIRFVMRITFLNCILNYILSCKLNCILTFIKNNTCTLTCDEQFDDDKAEEGVFVP